MILKYKSRKHSQINQQWVVYNFMCGLCDAEYGRRGALAEDFGGGVRRAYGIPYPISDQNMLFYLPCFRPGPNPISLCKHLRRASNSQC